MRKLRGSDISMIFQEPMTSLNPVLTIGRQIGETLRLHEGLNARQARGARGRHADPGRHPGAGPAGARISAPALRRHAPARDDRHGAGLQPEAADRRRADHRARRHHPGADPRPHARPQDAAGLGDHADHPRSRRGRRNGAARRGHVRRAARSRRRRSARSSPTRSTPTRAACSARCRSSARRSRSRGAPSWPRSPAQVPSLRQRIQGCPFASRCLSATDLCREVAPGGRREAARPPRRLPLRRIRDAAGLAA